MANLHIADKRNQGWFMIENDLIDLYGKDLGVYGIAVYCAIAKHANSNGENAYPSYQTIADSIGCSRRQVIRHIDKLVDMKLITKTQRFKENGDPTSNTYSLTNIPIPSDSQSPPSDSQSPPSDSQSPPSDSQSPGVVTHSHPNNTPYEQDPMNKRDLGSSVDQDSQPPPQPNEQSPPSFSLPKLKDNEYLPGLPNPQQREVKEWLDTIIPEVKEIGINPREFREMVDHVLAKHGKLEIAAVNNGMGQDALRKAQEAVHSICAIDKRFWYVSGIESVYKSWELNDWRGETLPTLKQLIEHAGLMHVGKVTCQRKDATGKPMVRQLNPDKPDKRWLLDRFNVDNYDAIITHKLSTESEILNAWRKHIAVVG